jgi:primosomal protein N' (replication factor Y)
MTSIEQVSQSNLFEPGTAQQSNYPASTTHSNPTLTWVEVLVDCPPVQNPKESQKLYTYAVPPDLTVAPGDIVIVPFGAQQLGGVVIQALNQLPPGLNKDSVKNVADVVSSGFFPPGYWTLLQQVADYYCTELMQVVRTALPPGLLGRSQRRIRLIPSAIPADPFPFLRPPAQKVLALLQASKQRDYSWRYLQQQVKQTHQGIKDLLQRGWVESYLQPPASIKPKRKRAVTLVASPDAGDQPTSRQQAVLDTLKCYGGDLELQQLLQQCHTSSSVVQRLADKGYVIIQEREVLRAESAIAQEPDQPKPPSPHQAQAIASLQALQTFTTVLLHGVTGSGKTEVYLQAIAPRLQIGQSVLVLVPEIGLTPQLTDRFRRRFGDRVWVYHSGLSDGERYDTWRQMLQGHPQVVIGTRSAVFAPLPRLGLIILDEEHDSSFKQSQPTPCYHARTVAQWRAQLANCPLVLGSATPALETWVSAGPEHANSDTSDQASQYLSLPQRIHNRPLPSIEVVDMRLELQGGNRSIFSRSLQRAIVQLQATGQQGILFIHRRGHSTFVSCRSCGEVMDCPHCDVSLAYHQTSQEAQSLLRCHYCNFVKVHPKQCPSCGSPYLKFFGSGTQRVAQELTRLFPELTWIRFDSDTTRRKGSHRALLSQFAAGEATLLVGTQMLTKGIDLPQVTLVGVLAADGLLHLPDFRAGERACQTLLQVAGRAGRGQEPGQVIVQTYSPSHSVIEAIKTHAYEPFLAQELDQREPLGYPPHRPLVLLRFSGADADTVRQTAERVGTLLQDHVDATQPGETLLLGPAPAPILRVANRYRWQILLKVSLRYPIATWLPGLSLKNYCGKEVSLTIDVDPLQLS